MGRCYIQHTYSIQSIVFRKKNIGQWNAKSGPKATYGNFAMRTKFSGRLKKKWERAGRNGSHFAHTHIVLDLAYRPVCKKVLAKFLTWNKSTGRYTWKITEVLDCHPVTNCVIAKSKMAAIINFENLILCYLEYMQVWYLYFNWVKCVEFISGIVLNIPGHFDLQMTRSR